MSFKVKVDKKYVEKFKSFLEEQDLKINKNQTAQQVAQLFWEKLKNNKFKLTFTTVFPPFWKLGFYFIFANIIILGFLGIGILFYISIFMTLFFLGSKILFSDKFYFRMLRIGAKKRKQIPKKAIQLVK